MTGKLVEKPEETLPADTKDTKTSVTDESGSDAAKLMGEIEGAIDSEKPTDEEKPTDKEEKPDAEEPAKDAEDEETADSKDGDDSKSDDEEAEVDADAIKDGEIKGLPPEVQERINRKIGKSTAKRKQAEERAAAAVAELADAKARIAEFEAKSTADVGANLMRLGVHESYLSPAEARLIKEEDTLKESRAFCRANRGGYEASGEGNDTKSYTADQVAERLDTVLDRLAEIAPDATAARRRAAKQLQEDLQLARDIRDGKKKLLDEKKAVQPADGPKKTLKPPPVPATSTPKPKPSTAKSGLTRKEVMESPDTREAMEALIEKSL